MQTKVKQKKYYPFLDGFRTLAIAWVLLYHILFFFNTSIIFTNIENFFKNHFQINIFPLLSILHSIFVKIASTGILGVDMFFVISGFLITGLLIDILETEVNIKRFYLRRAFKIIPQYFLAIITGLAIYSFLKPGHIISGAVPIKIIEENTNHLSYFLFLQNYYPYTPILGHTWSLAIEEHFYLFYPLSLFFLLNKTPVKKRLLKAILFCVSIIIICQLIRIFYFQFNKPLFSWPLKSPFVIQTTLFRIDGLIFGCLLRFLEPFYEKLEGKRVKIISFFSWILGIIIYLSFIFGPMTVGGFSGDTWYTYTLAYLAPGCLLFAAHRGFTAGVENKSLRWIGRHSYGIYLWHYILIFPAALFAPMFSPISAIFIYILIALLAGILSTMTIERYFLKLRTNFIP